MEVVLKYLRVHYPSSLISYDSLSIHDPDSIASKYADLAVSNDLQQDKFTNQILILTDMNIFFK